MNELLIYIYLLLMSTSIAITLVYGWKFVEAVIRLRTFVNADASVFEAVDAALDAHVKKIARLEYQVQQLTNGNNPPSDDLFTEEEIKSSSSDPSTLNPNEFNSEDAITDAMHGKSYRSAFEKYMDEQKRDTFGTFNTEDIVVVEMPTVTKLPKSKKKSKK